MWVRVLEGLAGFRWVLVLEEAAGWKACPTWESLPAIWDDSLVLDATGSLLTFPGAVAMRGLAENNLRFPGGPMLKGKVSSLTTGSGDILAVKNLPEVR